MSDGVLSDVSRGRGTGHRLDVREEVLAEGVAHEGAHVDETREGGARIRSLGLGPVRLTAGDVLPGGRDSLRVPIPNGGPDEYRLAWMTDASGPGAPSGTEAPPRSTLVLSGPVHPTALPPSEAEGQVRAAVLHIPRASLPLRPDHVELLLARPISTGSGSAAVLAAFLATLREHGAECRPEEQSRMGAIALDLATACLAEQLRVLETGTDESRAQTLLRRVHGFIAQNLADPDLTPQTIARRHHMSLRTLYGLFSRQPASVATVIRRGRLERCHADLARPDLRHLSVQVIASRWGFTNPSTFSRAFREAYGISPTEHRATTSASAPPDRSAA